MSHRSFLPFSSEFFSRAAVVFCAAPNTHFCTFIYYQLSGYIGYEHLNASRVSIYFSHALVRNEFEKHQTSNLVHMFGTLDENSYQEFQAFPHLNYASLVHFCRRLPPVTAITTKSLQ